MADVAVPPVRTFTVRDLATPGLLYWIRRDLANIDPVSFNRLFVTSQVAEMEVGGKRLSRRSLLRHLRRVGHDKMALYLMKELGIETGLAQAPELSMFTDSERPYVLFVLSMTLDWGQYYHQATALNTALTSWLGRSLQLAGLPDESRLKTGVPLFPLLVAPATSMPTEVAAALVMDVLGGKMPSFSRRQQAQLRSATETARKEAASAAATISASNEHERMVALVGVLLAAFRTQIGDNQAIVNRACLLYHKDYCVALDRHLTSEVESVREQLRLSQIPDCYVLVEGPSDAEYIHAAVSALGYADRRLRIEACVGKMGVKRRFQDIVRNHEYIGSVAALFDSDADPEIVSLRKPLQGSKLLRVVKLVKGDIEDCFRKAMQVRVLNDLYREHGQAIRTIDIGSGRRVNALKSALWNRKKVSFDKMALAREMRKRMTKGDHVPAPIREFLEGAAALADERARIRRRTDERIIPDDEAGRRIEELFALSS
jgi:hypothetical protein